MWIRSRYNIIAAILLAVFVILAVSSVWPDRKSATCDELSHHITAGYVYWVKGDFAFATAAPPLARLLISAPLLWMDPVLPDDRSYWRRADRGEFSYDFMYNLNRDIAKKILFYARLPVVFIGLIGGIFLFYWVGKRSGKETALLALLMYSLSPNILAHSRLATCDAVATVFIMMSVFSFWDFLDSPGMKRTLLAGICLGLALMAKYSALLLIPVFFIMILYQCIRYRSNYPGSAIYFFLCFVCTAFIVLWAGYGFEFRPFLHDVLRVEAKVEMFNAFAGKLSSFISEGSVSALRNALFTKSVPLSSFFLGVLGVLRHGSEGTGTYFAGQWREGGHRLYYIMAFWIKTPIPIIMSFIAGMILYLRDKTRSRLTGYLLAFIVVFFIFASKSRLQLGLRYVLPVYPFIFVIAAKGLIAMLKGKRLAKYTSVVLIAWLCGSTFFIWPNYISYFNEFIGGPANGYKYLRDSNIDWGQDLPALTKYMKKESIDKVRLKYFGSSDPDIYGVKWERFTTDDGDNPENCVYAVSVQKLEAAKWARDHEPDHRVGNSIFVYDFRERGQ
jgi:Dolichyl-phosphate-mannose-protein mannosyltransferase